MKQVDKMYKNIGDLTVYLLTSRIIAQDRYGLNSTGLHSVLSLLVLLKLFLDFMLSRGIMIIK